MGTGVRKKAVVVDLCGIANVTIAQAPSAAAPAENPIVDTSASRIASWRSESPFALHWSAALHGPAFESSRSALARNPNPTPRPRPTAPAPNSPSEIPRRSASTLEGAGFSESGGATGDGGGLLAGTS